MTTRSARSIRLKADLTLLLVAVIWGSAFVVQRLMALQMSVTLFNGLRFLLGGLALLPFALRRQPGSPRRARESLPWMGLAGVLLFSGVTLQQFGLRYTTAGNAGFITGLYVVLIPLILALAGRKEPCSVQRRSTAQRTNERFPPAALGSFKRWLGGAASHAAVDQPDRPRNARRGPPDLRKPAQALGLR